MAGDAHTSSVLDIKVNARELGQLEQTIKRTFNPAGARDFNTLLGQTLKLLAENTAALGRLAEKLSAIDKGNESFRTMNEELGEAKKRAEALDRQLANVSRTARGSGGGGGGGGGGRGWGGMPGIQAPMPGMGAISTALSAIPIGGLVAAGSLMAASQTYGSYLKYEQAQLQAAPYLQHSDRAIAGLQTRWSPRGMPARTPGGDAATLSGMAMGALDGATGGAASKTAGFLSFMQPWNLAQGAWNAVGPNGTIAQGAGEAMGMRAPVLRAPPAFGDLKSVERAQEIAGELVAHKVKPFNPKGYMDAAVSMGYTPQEGIDMAGQMSRSGRGPVGTDEFRTALAMQRVLGIDVGQTGGVQLGMARTGQGGDVQQVANLVGDAIAMGLESSEIQAELQKQTAFLEEQASSGIKFDSRSLSLMAMGLVSAGSGAFTGVQALETVRSFASGASQVGFKGPERAVDLRLMRAMGYTGRGGSAEYAKYRLAMQSPENVTNALPGYLGQFEKAGMNEDIQTLFIQQAMAQFGARIGPEQAQKLIGFARQARIDGKPMDMAALDAAGIDLTGSLGSATRGEAGIEAERIGIGGAIADDMLRLSKITNNMATSFMNLADPSLKLLTTGIEAFTAALAAGTATLGSR